MTESKMTEALDHLKDSIQPLVAAHEDSERARAEEHEAEVALVTEVLAIVRPAVRALGTRPFVSDAYIAGDNQLERTRASWRGIALTTTKPGAERLKVRRDDNDGAYGGSDVFLREDGKIIELTYAGSWSNWQNARCSWESAEREISIDTFVAEWTSATPENLVEHLQEIVAAAGDRGPKTAAARDRAGKLRAIVALLGGRS